MFEQSSQFPVPPFMLIHESGAEVMIGMENEVLAFLSSAFLCSGIVCMFALGW